MEFETITEEEMNTTSREGVTSVWTPEFKAELKVALDDRKNGPVEGQVFRISMEQFMSGYTGKSKNPKIPAHNLILSLIGIDYAKDKENRNVVKKTGNSISVDFTKFK